MADRQSLKRIASFVIAVMVGYTALHLHPQPLFTYSLRRGAVVLHARAPLPSRADEILADVEKRLTRSPLYRSDRTYDVFLCDTPALYAFFNPHHRNTGGETYVWLGNNIFLRPARVEADRLIGPSGNDVPGDRTLAYFIAHEVTHAMTVDTVGVWRYLALEQWQQDGYADYVAKAGSFDAAGALRGLRDGSRELDPARSGLYLRYQLLVAYLLGEGGVTVSELLAGPRAAGPIEARLLADPTPH